MSAKMNVPVLRFKEFSVEWAEKRLGDISSKVMYGIGSSAVSFDGINKYLRITDIDESSRTFISSPLTSPDGNIEEKYKLIDGDIVFARTGASVGKSYLYNPKDGNLIYAGFLIKFHIRDANPYFVYVNTFKEYYNKWVQMMSVRSGQPGINAEEYKLLPIKLPSKPEQEKIASFLSSVDTKIEQLTKKKTLLEQYKKGVMQKIFSQEIRFRDDDGGEYPEWVERKLGEVIITHRLGGNYTNTEIKSNHPLIKMGNINRGKININKLEYIKEGETVEQIDKIKYGDLFFNTRNTLDLVGKVAIWRDELPEAYYNSNLMSIKFENNFFMNYRLNSYEGIKALRSIATGTTSVAAIYTKDLLKIKLSLPSLKEQTKIANFLTSLDTKISQTGQQLEATKQFKKALLQQMFM